MSDTPATSSAVFGTDASIGKREIQEDAIGSAPLQGDSALPAVTVIADGMGGHAAGEVASNIAVTGFLDAYRRGTPGGGTTLIESLDWANGQIAGHVADHPETDGMGCTLIAVELNAESSAYRWISVGDSLLLSVAAGKVERLNADHSYREERERLIAAGESLDGAPAPNVLRSALMGFDVPLIDDHQEWRTFVPDETLILATDGIETLPDARIAEIVAANSGADAIAHALVAAVDAVGKPRQDNTSVAVLRPDGVDGTPVTTPASPAAASEQPTLTATPLAAAAASAEAKTLTAPPPLPAVKKPVPTSAKPGLDKTQMLLIAGAVALVVLIGVLLLVSNLGGKSEPAASAPPPSAANSQPAPAPRSEAPPADDPVPPEAVDQPAPAARPAGNAPTAVNPEPASNTATPTPAPAARAARPKPAAARKAPTDQPPETAPTGAATNEQ